jgi:hypothetical protein
MIKIVDDVRVSRCTLPFWAKHPKGSAEWTIRTTAIGLRHAAERSGTDGPLMRESAFAASSNSETALKWKLLPLIGAAFAVGSILGTQGVIDSHRAERGGKYELAGGHL